jgi:outer membrane protein assembly factor BamB
VNHRLVFVAIRGTAFGLERETGREVWRTPLKGGFVNLVLDRGDLYAAAHGELFCLDPATGRVRWNNPLKGMGYGIVTVATPTGSTPAGSIAAAAEQMDRDEAADAG